MKHKRLLIIVLLMTCVSLACSLPFLVKDEAAPGQPEAVQEQAEPGQPAEQEGPGLIEGLVDSVISEPNPNPVSFNRGLSTLNAYVVTGELEMSGPSAQEISRMILKQEFDQASDAMLRTIYNYSQTLEDPEPSESTMYIWRVGNDTCNGTDDPEDDYEFDSMEPDLREISDLMSDIFDMTFLVENPVFVGEEVIEGIACNHFSFQLSGLGVTSGASVLANQGEYWLAKEGDYMVKYYLLIETSPEPGKVNHLKLNMALTEINQPRSISMPQGCYDAQFEE